MLKKLSGITWRYYLFSFLAGLGFYTAALIPFYTEWGHISLTQVQLLQAWLMFWAFVLEIPTGVIADKFGRKYSVALGCLFTFFSFLVYGLFPNFYFFLLAEFLGAVGLALISGAGEALLYDSLKEEDQVDNFKNVSGRSFSLGQISAIISAPVGGFLAARYGLNAPMIASAFPALLAVFILMTAKEPALRVKKIEERNYLGIARKGISSFVHHKILRSLALNGILVYTGVYFLVWLYQPVLQNIGIAIVYFGFIRALFALSGMIFNHNLQFTEKVFGSNKNFFNVTAILTLVSFVLVAISPSLVSVLIAVIIIGGLGQARYVALSTYTNDHIPSEERATTLSTISMLNRIVLIILNPAVGFLADRSISGAFLAVGSLSLLAIIFVPIYSEKKSVEITSVPVSSTKP